MDASLTAALSLGFLLGIRHALDADHVAAVGTLVSQHRSLTMSCLLGTFWGLGHTMALLASGATLIAFKLTIPADVEQGFELGVGLLLMVLGAHVLLRSVGAWRLHRHAHPHDGSSHRHLHLHVGQARTGETPEPHQVIRVGGRSFLVGLLHGLAGSPGLMLLVLGVTPSAVGGLLYIVVFGVGSTVGMLALSGLIGIPFIVTSSRSHAAYVLIQILAGASSLMVGLALVWERTTA